VNSSDPQIHAPESETPEARGVGALLKLLDRPVSDADLAAGAAQAAIQPIPATCGLIGALVFRLNDETLAIPAQFLRRITPYTKPVPIPRRSSGLFRGLCNIRGELVLCADLHRLLSLSADSAVETPPSAASDPRRMIVIGPPDASWVFEVDSLSGMERINPAALRQPPLTVGRAIGAFVTGLTEIEGTPVTVLDGERVLAGFKGGLA
jgi:chemotaxis-related protein WspD